MCFNLLMAIVAACVGNRGHDRGQRMNRKSTQPAWALRKRAECAIMLLRIKTKEKP